MPFDGFDNNLQSDLLSEIGLLFFTWNKKSDDITANGSFDDIFPNSKLINPEKGRDFYRRVLKDDRSKIRLIFEDSKSNAIDREIDIRYQTENGEIVWFRIHLLEHRDNDNIYGSIQNITINKKNLLKTAYTAYTDDLTGLLNRARMKQKLALVLGYAYQNNIKYAFLIISIDNLASINSMFGHNIADEIIQAVGYKLAIIKRKSDIISRLSSGKFAILLTDVDQTIDSEKLDEIGNRFLEKIHDTNFITRSGGIYITVSGSGCILPEDAKSVEDVFTVADEALSVSKNIGHNTFTVYSKDFARHNEREENVIISGKIVNSVKQDLITAAFQPVINHYNPDKSFLEVLARIRNSDGSLLPAFKFIPIAENTGFIRIIDLKIIEYASSILQSNKDISLSVNISGLSLSNHRSRERILNILYSNIGISDRLIIEITETVALQDISGIDEFMVSVSNMNYRIALDDFGAGYNSFSNLKTYDFDMVKIDGSYIRDIHKDKKSQTLVNTLAKMSQDIGIDVVAEMVSQPEDLEIIEKYPINYYQGFMFGKPEEDLITSINNMKQSIDILCNNTTISKRAL